MKTTSILSSVAALALLVGCNRSADNSGAASDQSTTTTGSGDRSTMTMPDTNGTSAARPADNTGLNERDRSGATLTPGDQGGSDADREMTRKIRRAITSNDQLSADAKNIKIITIDGKVTVRGPVKTEEERKAIASILQQSGVQSVDNQLEVKATNQ